MAHEQKLAGGVAVITGAGSGIGAGLARRAGELGMTVVVTDIVRSQAETVAESIRNAGGKADAIAVDVSKLAELDRLAETVFANYGSTRLLVNNAGIETLGFSWEIPTERWEKTLNTNIHGVIHSVRTFVPKILATNEECWIANLASIGAFSMMPTQSAYILTRHAVQSFSESLYLEMQLKKAPIHVSSVIPGMLKTSIFEPEAGAGEPEHARKYRTAMREMMANHGMNVDEGCRRIIAKIAANDFWVDTQPDMTSQALDGRIAFFSEQRYPELADQARYLVE